MRTVPILTDNIKDRITAIDKELQRLEHIHNLNTKEVYPVVTPTNDLNGVRVTSLKIWQFHTALWLRGSTLTFNAGVGVGFWPYAPGNWCDYELRYYQQVPSIYTAAERANRTVQGFIVLASGRVDALTYDPGIGSEENGQSIVEIVDLAALDIQGTYGRIEVWLQGSSDDFGERSYFYVDNVEVS